MTAINQFLKFVFAISLVLSASGLLASVQYFHLKTPDQPLAKPTIDQGGALAIRVNPTSQVWFNEKPIFIDSEGNGLIAIHRDGKVANLKLQTKQGQKIEHRLDIRQREYRIERIDGLPPAKVSAPPDPKIQARIREESLAIRTARNRNDDREDFMAGFIWPVEGRISGRYGSQRILNGKPKTPHYGVDVAVPTGTPVMAPADGIIIYSNPDMYYSGGTLVIDHGHGLSSAFLHLSELLITTGDKVKQGQIIAKVGATGRATGPHLDWRMNWGSSVRIDPQLIVEPMNKK